MEWWNSVKDLAKRVGKAWYGIVFVVFLQGAAFFDVFIKSFVPKDWAWVVDEVKAVLPFVLIFALVIAFLVAYHRMRMELVRPAASDEAHLTVNPTTEGGFDITRSGRWTPGQLREIRSYADLTRGLGGTQLGSTGGTARPSVPPDATSQPDNPFARSLDDHSVSSGRASRGEIVK